MLYKSYIGAVPKCFLIFAAQCARSIPTIAITIACIIINPKTVQAKDIISYI